MSKQLHACPCCGERTLREQNDYEICNNCRWEDDPGQRKHPNDNLGANSLSLNQHRAEANWLLYRCMEMSR